MADIIPMMGRMPATGRRKALTPPAAQLPGAEILLFTGVRYERAERICLISEQTPEGNQPFSGTSGPGRH